MSPFSRIALLSLLVLSPAAATAGADAGAAAPPRPQLVGLRVSVDAAGKVQSATPIDPAVLPALNSAAGEIARKLTFTPARKDGRAVASETTLSVTLALEPKANGQYGLVLRRAHNGPTLLAIGKSIPPRYQQGKENGALVVVGANLRADGSLDMDSLKTERMELRVPSTFAEARYLDVVKNSLQGSRFQLDKVDGVEIPSRLSIPFRFGGGPTKPKPGDEPRRGAAPPREDDLPALSAVSSIPGVELPQIRYEAPARP